MFPQSTKAVVVYDDQCAFCRRAVRVIHALNLLGWVYTLGQSEVSEAFCEKFSIQREEIKDFFVLSLRNHHYTTGFYGYRKLAAYLPVLWVWVPLLYLPPVPWFGQQVYRWVAARRYQLGCSEYCQPK